MTELLLLLQSLISANKDPSWKRESEFHVLVSRLQPVSLEAVFSVALLQELKCFICHQRDPVVWDYPKYTPNDRVNNC